MVTDARHTHEQPHEQPRVRTTVRTTSLIVALSLLASCATLFGSSGDGSGPGSAARGSGEGSPAGGSGAPPGAGSPGAPGSDGTVGAARQVVPGAGSGRRSGSGYRDGLQQTLPDPYRAEPRLRALVKRYAKYREDAVGALASRLGVVLVDRPRRIYVRFERQPAEAAATRAPAACWARLDRLVIDGNPRPVISIYPEALLLEQLTLREALSFEMARAALFDRMGSRYHRLPRWWRLGMAYHAAERTGTLLERLLSDLMIETRAPATLLPSPADVGATGDKPKAQVSWAREALFGGLVLDYVESNYGVKGVKALVDATTRRDDPMSFGAAVERALGVGQAELWAEFEVFARQAIEERARGVVGEFRAALQATYVKKQFADAIRRLMPLRDAAPHGYGGPVIDYWIGRSYFELKQYDLAHQRFAAVLSGGARTFRWLDRALLWAARCRLGQKRRGPAVGHLERLVRDFPGSDSRPPALYLLGKSLARMGEDARAEAAFASLLAEAPDHTHAAETRLLLARARLARFALGPARRDLRPLLADGADVPADVRSRAEALAGQLDQIEAAPLPPAREKEVTLLVGRVHIRGAIGDGARARLAEIGPVAAPAVGRALARAVTPRQRTVLIELLSALASPRAAPYLVARLGRADKAERRLLLRGLLRVGVSPELLPDMLSSAGVPAAVRKQVAVELDVLALHTTPALREKLPRIVPQLTHPEAAERLAGVAALNRLQDRDGVAPLATLLADPDPRVRREAIDGLAVWGDDRALPAIRKALADDQPHVRRVALEQLGRYRYRKAETAVFARLRDADPVVRATAYRCAGELARRKAIPALLGGLADDDDGVRAAASEALLAVAGHTPADRRAAVAALIPRVEQAGDDALRARQLGLLGRLTRLDIRSYPGMPKKELVRQLDRARLWLTRR